jgi:creatinine amidohydrolase/Fe(II)-dependent formamide hydrolase-like protein
MLELAAHLVRQDLVPSLAGATDTNAMAAMTAAMIFDRGVSFPWRTDDPRLAANGVIGDAQGASTRLGRDIVDSIVAQTRPILGLLLKNQNLKTRSGD